MTFDPADSTSAPDLEAEIVPGVRAAGFALGETYDSIARRIGHVEWYQADASLESIIVNNSAWIGVNWPVGTALKLGKTIQSFVYKDNIVRLLFGESKRLYRIAIGRGYQGRFHQVLPGDDLSLLESSFELDFNDHDEDFLILKDGHFVEGISFITDYRASLEHAPDQTIEHISVHNWSLR